MKASIFLGCGKGGLSPEEEVTQWCNTFRKIVEQCSQAFEERGSYSSYKRSASGAAPAATMLSPDKLYKVFQEILKIRSIEHQVLYRECQVGVARVELEKGWGQEGAVPGDTQYRAPGPV